MSRPQALPGRPNLRSTADWPAQHAANAALASGILAVLSAVSLILFGIVEAPAGVQSGATQAGTFVRLSDAFGGIAALVAIPVAFRFDSAWRRRGAGASRAALAVGLVSLIGYATLDLSYAGGINEPTIQGPLTVLAIGGIGLWILIASFVRADSALDATCADSELQWALATCCCCSPTSSPAGRLRSTVSTSTPVRF
jgi:hypothetical protein